MDKIALTNVRVFDGERLLEPGTVVIDGDRIGDDANQALPTTVPDAAAHRTWLASASSGRRLSGLSGLSPGRY